MTEEAPAAPGEPARVAMWSGPRNISTALMRAWENRGDTAVVDEPFYAYFLNATGLEHPMHEAVIASQPTEWREVAATLTGAVPGGKAIAYHKHMTHHMLPEIERDWLAGLANCFLIRDPQEVLRSYVEKRGPAEAVLTGFEIQVELFETVRTETGVVPPVLDARDVLEDPRTLLTGLCEAVGVEFMDKMLSWPPGRRASDGVWGAHWYDKVIESRGFARWRPPEGPLHPDLEPLAKSCRPFYRELYEHLLRP